MGSRRGPATAGWLGIRVSHATTIARVLQRLDIHTFELLLADWTQNLRCGTSPDTRTRAFDIEGKEVRRAKDGNRKRVHLLSAAIDQGSHAVLSQVSVGIKNNEITQFTTLLYQVVELKVRS